MDTATPPLKTWGQTADEVVAQVFAGKDLSTEQRAVLSEAVQSLAAVHGQYSRSDLESHAYTLRSLMH